MLKIFLLLISTLLITGPAAAARAPKPDWNYVERQLKAHKFKKSFIAMMKKDYDDAAFKNVLELNVLLFLKKSNYHGPQVSSDGAIEVREFMRKHRKALDLAEKRYKVPANVIVSLIWLESRLGRNKGTFHVPSVYIHLLQAKRPEVIAYLKTRTKRFTTRVTAKQLKDIPRRAKRKSTWAIEELRAIAKIHDWKWEIGRDFKGSFAGAFGMPQFIPSSYTKWARAVDLKSQPRLHRPEDSIMSVAYYLKDHGWKSNSPKKRIEALMKYNNSRDYALAILALAKRTSEVKEIAAEKVANSPLEPTTPEKLEGRVQGDAN